MICRHRKVGDLMWTPVLESRRLLHRTSKTIQKNVDLLAAEENEFSGLKSISELPRDPLYSNLTGIWRLMSRNLRRELYKLQPTSGGPKHQDSMRFVPYPSPIVKLFEPELVEKAFRNEGPTPVRGTGLSWKEYRKERGEKAGTLIGEGEEWKRNRSIIAKKILPTRNLQSFEPVMLEVIDDLIDKLTDCVERDALDDPEGRRIVRDLPNEISKWAMESVGTVLFETRLGCLEDPVPEDVQRFVDAIAEVFLSVTPASIFYKWQRKLGSPIMKRHFEAWDYVFDFTRRVVNRRKSELLELSKTTEVSKSRGAVLTYLLLDENLSDEEVIGNTVDLLLGGVDTTSNTLVFALYELARNPQHYRRLEAEVEDVLGREEAPSVAAVARMPFLRNCLKETLRMYPLVVGMLRKMDQDMELGGYFIPKGTLVRGNFYDMCMSEKYFEDPRSFNPERWDRETGKKFHPFTTLPFGYGPRSCIGKRLAEMELHLTLARIAQKFHLRYVASLPEMTPVLRTILSPPPGEIIPIELIKK